MTYTEISQMKEMIKSVIDCTPATFSIDQANAYLKNGIMKIIDDFIQPEQIVVWTEEEKNQIIDTLGKVSRNMAEVLGHMVGKPTCYRCKYLHLNDACEVERTCGVCSRAFDDRFEAEEET